MLMPKLDDAPAITHEASRGARLCSARQKKMLSFVRGHGVQQAPSFLGFRLEGSVKVTRMDNAKIIL